MSKYEIHKGDPTQVDAIGFQTRLEGKEVRDCLLILEPEGKCTSGLLVRGEIEGTVHECIVRNGEGVLNIDGSRISSDISEMEGRSGQSKFKTKNVWGDYGEQELGTFFKPNKEGRFPSNLILKHGAGCKCVGTKKVKGNNQPGGDLPNLHSWRRAECREDLPDSSGYKMTGYAGKDGKEEVANSALSTFLSCEGVGSTEWNNN